MRQFDSDIPVFGLSTIDQHLARREGPIRFATYLMMAFGLATLVLSCVGVYGLLTFDLAERRREIGIRKALGARGWDHLRYVLGRGLGLASKGVAIGVLAGFFVDRLTLQAVVGQSGSDPLSSLLAGGLLLLVAFAACLVPALRSMRVDPLVALRE